VQQLLAVADDLADKGTALGKGTTAKAWAVQHILHSCEKRKEKLVIFSQYLMDLDELEQVLQQVSKAYIEVLIWLCPMRNPLPPSCTKPPCPPSLSPSSSPPSSIDNASVLTGSAAKSCSAVQKFQWSKGKQYLRLDGKLSSHIRQQHTRLFNDPSSSVQVLEHFTRCHLVKDS